MSSKITKISAKPRESQPHADEPHEDQRREDKPRENQNPEGSNRDNDNREKPNRDKSVKTVAENTINTPKTERKLAKSSKKPKLQGDEKPLKSVFILARPFVALGRYLRDSWRELRMVRWPSRKATWKMTLAVLVYCAIFIVFIVLLDMLFTFIFNLIFGTN